MRTATLLNQLQLKASRLSENRLRKRLGEAKAKMAAEPTPILSLSIYSLEAFFETIKANVIDDDSRIDVPRLKAMKGVLAKYLEKHSAGQTEFNTFTELVCVYLTFIAKRPLNPASMFDLLRSRDDSSGRCPIRKDEILKEDSLCRFCINS